MIGLVLAKPSKRALILDFGGVISRSMFETHAVTEKALGLAPGSLTWQGPFNPGSDPLWQDLQLDKITERDYWLIRTREVGTMLGERWDNMETFVQRARGDDPQNAIRPEMQTVILAAKTAGLKLAILSNELDLFYGPALRAKLKLLEQFDVILDATYTGVLKPDARAYQSCMTALGLRASEVLFVDDQWRNVEGAKRLGIACVHFDVLSPELSCKEILVGIGLS